MKTALITGAARGIGLATARGLQEAGWQVALMDRDGAELEKAAGHHSPLFKITPEPAVTLGVEASVAAAEGLMPRTN